VTNKPPDFIAKLIYFTTEQGGRRTPAFSGYRPQVKFAFSDMQTSGQQIFLDKETVYPGDIVEAEISIISTEFFAGVLEEGMPFEFREASQIIGAGTILKILNPVLQKNIQCNE
jgi:translation elongation factor EF-Tu-like GTPase